MPAPNRVDYALDFATVDKRFEWPSRLSAHLGVTTADFAVLVSRPGPSDSVVYAPAYERAATTGHYVLMFRSETFLAFQSALLLRQGGGDPAPALHARSVSARQGPSTGTTVVAIDMSSELEGIYRVSLAGSPESGLSSAAFFLDHSHCP